jgi:D-glycero-alpha-D-manno-heptose-7-phosphate kinase
MYESARKNGALGGKITGAGGGGFLLFYCQFEKKLRIAEALRKLGAIPKDFAFEGHGLQTWRVQEIPTTVSPFDFVPPACPTAV